MQGASSWRRGPRGWRGEAPRGNKIVLREQTGQCRLWVAAWARSSYESHKTCIEHLALLCLQSMACIFPTQVALPPA